MEVKCIALDLDGTTLCDDKSISPENKAAIEEAVKRGIHVFVASGRCLDALPESITSIKGIEYAITSNGAAVYRLKDQVCLHRRLLPKETVRKVLALTKDMEITYEFFYEGVPYARREYVEDPLAYGAVPYAIDYIRRTRRPVDDIESFIRSHETEGDGLDLITRDMELKMRLWKLLEKELPDSYITSSVSNRIELSSREAGKHNGLKFLLDHLGLRAEEAAAFGDADNDKEMLAFAGCGMAVANGTEGCKAAADLLVPSNTDHGVAWGIRKLLG